jgi:hypothetical protein
MQFYLHGEDGQRFGPVDLATLSAWAQEGRLSPDSVIEYVDGGACLRASELEGVDFVFPDNPRPNPGVLDSIQAESDITSSKVLSWIAIGLSLLFLCPVPFFPLAGLVASLLGCYCINRVERNGFTGFRKIRILNNVAIVTSIILLVVNILTWVYVWGMSLD